VRRPAGQQWAVGGGGGGGGGGAAGSGAVAGPAWISFFYLLFIFFALCHLSTPQTHCHVSKKWLTAKPSLSALVCHVLFAVCKTRQTLCWVHTANRQHPVVRS